jgi:hypothetical protein
MVGIWPLLSTPPPKPGGLYYNAVKIPDDIKPIDVGQYNDPV